MVEKLFKDYESAGDDTAKKSQLARQICMDLVIHTHLEEEIFYPACREKDVGDDSLDEAQVEHDGAKVMIADLLKGKPDDAYYDAKVTVLSEYIKHHVNEEEKPRDGIMAQARKKGVDLTGLGQRIQARKTELQEKGEILANEPLRAPSIHLRNIESTSEEESASSYAGGRNRYQGDSYRSYGSQTTGRSYMQRGEGDYDDGGIGRLGRNRESYDEEGDRYASGRDYRSTREDYGQRSGRSRPRDEDEDSASRRGWTSRYGRGDDQDQDRGYRGRSRYEENEDRRYGRGQERERDEYGRFMSDEDEDYGRHSSSRSRPGSQSSRGERSSGSRGGQDQRGWHGDHRGHSQAARRGWQNRD
jgi:hypothetical protein